MLIIIEPSEPLNTIKIKYCEFTIAILSGFLLQFDSIVQENKLLASEQR